MLRAALGAGCLLLSGNVSANDEPPIQSGQYVHQSWTIRDGAPPGICAMAQAPDGYLWLGTGTGLYRFDGVQFTRYRPEPGQHLASNDITALKFVADGGLWMGSYYGGATLLKDGKLTPYSTREGFPPGWVLDFAEGPDGQVWAATGQGLGRFDGTRWHQVGSDWNYPADRADWVLFDASGTLWAAAVNQLVYLRRGAKQFQATNIALAPGAVLAVDKDGTLWVSDRLHGTRPLRGLSADHPRLTRIEALPVSEEEAATRFTFDHYGALWATSLGTGGVYRVAQPGQISIGENVTTAALSDLFMAPRGLTSNNAVPVIEDREGNMWVGTNLGIDSYRPSRVGTLSDFHIDPHAHISVSKDSLGNLWVSNQGSVYKMQNDKPVQVLSGLSDILSLLITNNDTLWVIGRHDLYRYLPPRLEKIPIPNHLFSSRLKFAAPGQNGAIWTAIEGLGIFKLSNDAWERWVPRTPGLKVSPSAGAIGPDGSKWFGYVGSELLHVDSMGQERFYNLSTGVDIGTVATISIGERETLFAGDSGLARFHNGSIQSITDRDSPVLTGITGVAQTDNGDVWLNTGRGIVRYASSELDKAFNSARYRPKYDLFDFHDGVQGVALQGQPVSTLLSTASGRIWFVTNEVMQWIEPTSRYRNPIPPPVYVRSVSADGKQYETRGEVKLPKGITSLQIDYTALSLSSPTRVRFKYRMDGFDKGWLDAGTRRQAYYTNLPPRAYRFNVIAANDDGVWNSQGASVGIVITPSFHQTPWFRILTACLVAILITLAYFARVRHVARNIRLQSDARHEERERIARDLHDTLLQAVHALMLRFQALAAAIPKDDPLQIGIKSTLKVASSFITEGRDRVKTLRTTITSTTDLSNSIIQLALELEKASSIAVDTQARIYDQDIDPGLGDDIFSICRESLINAFRHANAGLISVRITGRTRHLHITIADDGTGIPPAVLENLADTGHWGIVGMQERASHISAQLSIVSSHAGTVVDLDVPFRSIRRRHAPGAH